MLNKLRLTFVGIAFVTGIAHADVDVNKANQAALDGIRGIGPKTSSAILEERKKNGDFKDWADLESRVKGVGEKSAVKLSEAGLTVNGQRRVAVAAKDEKKTVAVAKKEGPAKNEGANK